MNSLMVSDNRCQVSTGDSHHGITRLYFSKLKTWVPLRELRSHWATEERVVDKTECECSLPLNLSASSFSTSEQLCVLDNIEALHALLSAVRCEFVLLSLIIALRISKATDSETQCIAKRPRPSLSKFLMSA